VQLLVQEHKSGNIEFAIRTYGVYLGAGSNPCADHPFYIAFKLEAKGQDKNGG
jgi:hypothetical protein